MSRVAMGSIMLCLILLLGACSASQSGAMKTIKLVEKDAGGTFTLNAGDTLEIALAGNPTTGYSWEHAANDSTVLDQIGEPEYKTDSNLVGAGGQFTFRFCAVVTGQAMIRLIYHRPWEKEVAPLKTFEVTIVVK